MLGQNAKDFFKTAAADGETGSEAFAYERAVNSIMITCFLFVIGLLILLLGVFKACLHNISKDHDMSVKYVKKSNSRAVQCEEHQQVVFRDSVDFFKYPDEMTKLIMQHNERRRKQE
jgi:hypothetical protein